MQLQEPRQRDYVAKNQICPLMFQYLLRALKGLFSQLVLRLSKTQTEHFESKCEITDCICVHPKQINPNQYKKKEIHKTIKFNKYPLEYIV